MLEGKEPVAGWDRDWELQDHASRERSIQQQVCVLLWPLLTQHACRDWCYSGTDGACMIALLASRQHVADLGMASMQLLF